MFELGHLEVSAVLTFAPSGMGDHVPELQVHDLRLGDLTSSPEVITGAVDRHLREHLEGSFTTYPDREDRDGGLSFVTMSTDTNEVIVRSSAALRSRCLEPRVACEQWGVSDVAEHLRVSPATVRSYLSRAQMPAPDGYISGTPWWVADRIRDWDRPKGRR